LSLLFDKQVHSYIENDDSDGKKDAFQFVVSVLRRSLIPSVLQHLFAEIDSFSGSEVDSKEFGEEPSKG
jgi:hypothetical protein